MPAIRSFVFYDGPSLIDGAPIIGVAVLRSKIPDEYGSTVRTVHTSNLTPILANGAVFGD